MKEKNNESLFSEDFLKQFKELTQKIDPNGEVLKTSSNSIKELNEYKRKLELEKTNEKYEKIINQR